MDPTALSLTKHDAPAKVMDTAEEQLPSPPNPPQVTTSSSVLDDVPNLIPATQISRKRKVALVSKTTTTIDKTTVEYVKPSLSYVCLIALAMKNSHTGCLLRSQIYNFISEHFPYFSSASEDWKRVIRKNLSSRKYFKTTDRRNACDDRRTNYLWQMDPS